ncbi:MAG: PD40 domain-containing protein [Candidatus Brocadiae bacterium]|nr:PD40 domain-containing protein [Candidatus Brocadiia bacterium]
MRKYLSHFICIFWILFLLGLHAQEWVDREKKVQKLCLDLQQFLYSQTQDNFVSLSQRALSEIIHLLQEDDAHPQLAALKILIEIAAICMEKVPECASVVPRIAEILANKTSTKEIRAQAARALGHLFLYATPEAIKAIAEYTEELRIRWREASKDKELPEEIGKKIAEIEKQPEENTLPERMKSLASQQKAYEWLLTEGLRMIQEQEVLITKRHEEGKAFLEKAKWYLEKKQHFEAKMSACRAIGFMGFGGPVAEYPPLLQKGSEEWKNAEDVVRYYAHIYPVWQSTSCPMIENYRQKEQYPSGVSQDFIDSLKRLSPLDPKVDKEDSESLASVRHVKNIKILDVSIAENVTYSPDGKTLVLFRNGNMRIWDTVNAKEIAILSIRDATVRMVYSPNGKFLASYNQNDNTVKTWDASSGQNLSTFSLSSEAATTIVSASIAYSPDRKFLAFGTLDNTIKIWDTVNAKEIAILYGHSDAVQSLAYSPDGKFLASGSWDNTIKIWSVACRKEISTFSGHSNVVMKLVYSPDSKWIASSSWDRTIKIWDVSGGKVITSIPYFLNALEYDMAYSPDGKFLAFAGTKDKTIKIWNIAGQNEITTLSRPSGSIGNLAYSPDSQCVFFFSSKSNAIKRWNIASGQKFSTLCLNSDEVTNTAHSPDGKFLACAGVDKTIKIWGIDSGILLTAFVAHSDAVISVAYSPDGKFLASTGEDDTIKIWDVAEEMAKRSYHNGKSLLSIAWEDVIKVEYTPDGKYLISQTYDETIHVWEIVNGIALAPVGHSDRVTKIVYSPDGRYLASSSKDKTIKIWDIAAGKVLATIFSGYESPMFSYSPNGKFLAYESMDKTIKIWDIELDRVSSILPCHNKRTMLLYSLDGKFLASSNDKIIEIWDMPPGKGFISMIKSIDGQVESADGKCAAFINAKFAAFINSITIELINLEKQETMAIFYRNVSQNEKMISKYDTFLASVEDKNITIWQNKIGTKKLVTLSPPSDQLSSIAYSPDGQFIAFGSSNSIKIWEIKKDGGSDHQYASYVNFLEWKNLDICWKYSPSFYHGQASVYWMASPDSYLSILRSNLPEEQKNQQLFLHYIKNYALNSAFAVYKKLTPGTEKKKLSKILQKSLLDQAFGIIGFHRLSQLNDLEKEENE